MTVISKWLILAAAIVSEVTATLSLRASIDSAWWIPLVAVGYVLAFALVGMLLRTGMPIGVAYGIWGAAGVALTALLGVVLFDEVLGLPAIIGIVLIIAGVALVETGASTDSASPQAKEAP